MNSPISTSEQQFYIHISDTQIYYKIYTILEKWLSDNIFREDASRVFLASNEYAFRRRFELTDMSKDYSELQPSSLNFPFANYWPMNTGWIPDDRIAGNNAYMLYNGITIGTTRVKASLVQNKIPVTFYFDREDDARLAYSNLHFFTFNDHYSTFKISFAENLIDVPLALTIKDLSFNPSFKESDWLKQNRIFTIQATFVLRTYEIFPPKQPNYKLSLGPDGCLIDTSGTTIGKYDDSRDKFILTNEVILNLMNNKGLVTSSINYLDYVASNNIDIDKLIFEIDPLDFSKVTLKWIMKSYKDSSGNIDEDNPQTVEYILMTLNSGLNQTLIKKEECEAIKLDESPQFIRYEYHYTIDNLMADSIYNVYLEFKSKGNGTKMLFNSFKTPESIKSAANKSAPKNALVGIKW